MPFGIAPDCRQDTHQSLNYEPTLIIPAIAIFPIRTAMDVRFISLGGAATASIPPFNA